MLSSPTKVKRVDSEIDTGILSDKLGWGQSSSMDTKGSLCSCIEFTNPNSMNFQK
jgi:hypothetical protein